MTTSFAIPACLPVYVDARGALLEAGYIWFGLVSQNPEVAPIAIYWDKELTQPAAQPLRTSGGVIVRDGTPSAVFAAQPASVLIKDSRGRMVTYRATIDELSQAFLLQAAIDSGLLDLKTLLASNATAAVGLGMVGWSILRAYGAGTAGRKLLQRVNVDDFGAVGDGATDDSFAIQAACTAAQRVEFTPDKTYMFREVTLRANQTIDATGATLKLVPGRAGIYHAFFVGSAVADVTIQGGSWDGNRAAHAPDAINVDLYACIYLIGCDRATVRNAKFRTFYGNAAVRVRDGSNVAIVDNYFESTTNDQQGAYYNVTGSRTNYNIALDRNQTLGCGLSVNDDLAAQWLFNWSISSNKIRASNTLNQAGIGARASDGVIDGNDITSGYFLITASSGGATFTQHDLRISNNTLTADSGTLNPYGIEHYANRVQIIGNKLNNCCITTSNGTGSNCIIADNQLRSNLDTNYTQAAISFGSGSYNNINITHNSCRGYGTFLAVDRVPGGLCVVGNSAELTYYAGESSFVTVRPGVAGPHSFVGHNISANYIKNANRGFIYYDGTVGAMTLSSLRAIGNALEASPGRNMFATTLDSTCLELFNDKTYPVFANLPTASAGLPSGAFWRDAADANRVKAVP